MYKLLIPLILFASPAFAGVSVGVMHQTYGEDLSSGAFSAQVKAGKSLYVWGGYEKPELYLVGQEIGSSEIYSAGVGYEKNSFFIEFGYFRPKTETIDHIRDEGVTTSLNNNHGWAGFRRFEETTYEIAPGYGGRVGYSHQIHKRFSVQASYRFLALTEEMDATVGECSFPLAERSDTCDSWWQERDDKNFNAFEVGLFFRF